MRVSEAWLFSIAVRISSIANAGRSPKGVPLSVPGYNVQGYNYYKLDRCHEVSRILNFV